MVAFQFGKFEYICNQLPLPLCTALNLSDPQCYARNISLGNWLVFEPGVIAIHIVGILMTFIMIYHVKTKYTAVGRKEMVYFFYFYLADLCLGLLLVSNIIPMASGSYVAFTAIHAGLVAGTFWMLLMNGFVGFQWAEDGTPKSLWIFRISAVIVVAGFFFCAFCTFKSAAGFDRKFPIVFYCLFLGWIVVCSLIYFITQIILIRTLDDYWALGPILMAFFCFGLTIGIMMALSVPLCRVTQHYLDGMFFTELLWLFAVMMIYKYWDSITKEDLEFALPNIPQTHKLLGDQQSAMYPIAK